jgi:hypothetical protein
MTINDDFLALILHHANRVCNHREFYAIKKHLLKKFGTHIGVDIQYLPPRKCHSCQGTGIYSRFPVIEKCYSCNNGVYLPERLVMLNKYTFGKYTFHVPLEVGESPDFKTCPVIINGLVQHEPSEYGLVALAALYKVFNKEAYKKYFTTAKRFENDDLPF